MNSLVLIDYRVRAAHHALSPPAAATAAAGVASPPALARSASVPRLLDLPCAGLDALWPAGAPRAPHAHVLEFCPLGRTPSTF